MSVWTHVNASFRLNSLDPIADETIYGIFGEEMTYSDMVSGYAECIDNPLPNGSEGSLHIDIWHNSNTSAIASTTVNVFGDLRDYDSTDCDKLVEWFKECCDKCSFRSAVMEYNPEDCKGYYIATARRVYNKEMNKSEAVVKVFYVDIEE